MEVSRQIRTPEEDETKGISLRHVVETRRTQQDGLGLLPAAYNHKLFDSYDAAAVANIFLPGWRSKVLAPDHGCRTKEIKISERTVSGAPANLRALDDPKYGRRAAKIGQLQTRPFSGLQLHTDFIFSGDCGNPGLGNCSLHEFLEILESARPNLPPAGPIPAASSSRWGPGRLAAAFVVVSAPLEKGRALESPLGALRKGNTDCAEQYSYTVMLSQ
ncbi:hypothetical protein TsFJ059_003266 [Trichoderma semiorbis]|uniref:Uncharacterized protein n=1 Tax=Trichoderma semiorbis TaxID=1491008 RepID=A0A9P8HTD5_9HYPO|nr:hypothetical protein TsFJ059_003266 [Trichoderma semiorbis]